MIEVNKFKIGLFTAGGFILLIIMLFLLGGASMFDKKIKLVTLVSESVQGLEKGGQVKYKGVPVGSPRQPFCFFPFLFHGDGVDPCLLYNIIVCP